MILIACDSFKDALSAKEVCRAIRKGLLQAIPTLETQCFPMADGGEGTLEALMASQKATSYTTAIYDPLMRIINASYGLSSDGKTAFIDMAQASGLQLLSPKERNPMRTTSFGTGELIREAIGKGANKILLGIGGSATNDAGMGMAKALGYQFLNVQDQPLQGTGEELSQVAQIIPSPWFAKQNIKIEVLCDVDNPLFGTEGAAHQYAPQKGANPQMVESLDKGLRHLATILQEPSAKGLAFTQGAGAAGGMGFGCIAFLQATLTSGIEAIMQYSGLLDAMPQASFLITGEGKIDGQTARGKVIMGIAQKAKAYKLPVIVLCGTSHISSKEMEQIGIHEVYEISPDGLSLAEALVQTSTNLTYTAYEIGKSWVAKGR